MSEPEPESKSKRKKKDKKKKIEISLWINNVAYEHGQKCTFCTKVTAMVHCPECHDFYCIPCDVTAHSTKKRKMHKRNVISYYTKDEAARLVTMAVRYHGKLLTLQKKCRAKFRRYYDRKTLNHYYYNPVYGTVSWTKPYCLRKEELFPFIDAKQAASVIQCGLYHTWKARQRIIKHMDMYYKKIFDRRYGFFYYAWNGKSLLLPRQSWKKPLYCGKRGFPRDVHYVFTVDVAALLIQRKWRTILIRRFFAALCRANHDEIFDPVEGGFTYKNIITDVVYKKKPLLVGSNAWNPNFIPDWKIPRVILFFRRIGLKQYVPIVDAFGIDGRVLVFLDDFDFDNIGIMNKVHRRKILVEIAKIYKPDKRVTISAAHQERRDGIRKKKLFHESAIKCQTYFRMYKAKKELYLLSELKRIAASKIKYAEELKKNGVWWTNRNDIPSKKMVITDNPFDTITSFLPPIKQFGRKRDHLTSVGWGKFQNGEYLTSDGTDAHPTQICTLRLLKSGYDKRRFAKLQGKHFVADYDDEEFLKKQKEKAKERLELKGRFFKEDEDGLQL